VLTDSLKQGCGSLVLWGCGFGGCRMRGWNLIGNRSIEILLRKLEILEPKFEEGHHSRTRPPSLSWLW
jgi:hypothetical protein